MSTDLIRWADAGDGGFLGFAGTLVKAGALIAAEIDRLTAEQLGETGGR